MLKVESKPYVITKNNNDGLDTAVCTINFASKVKQEVINQFVITSIQAMLEHTITP